MLIHFLNRLRRLPLTAKFALVLALAPSQVLFRFLCPQLGAIWILVPLIGVLGAMIMTLPQAFAAAGIVLATWFAIPLPLTPPEQPALISNSVQIVVFCLVATWIVHVVTNKLAFYHALARTSGDLVYMIDTQGRIAFVNDAIPPLLGYRKQELIGQSMSLFTPAWYQAEAANSLANTLKSKTPTDRQFPVLTRAGQELTFSARVQSFQQNGKLYLLGVAQNRTGSDRNERLFMAAFDATDAPAVVRDNAGVIVACNRAYADTLGKTKEEITGTTLPPYRLSADDLPGWVEEVHSTEPVHREVQLPDGRSLKLNTSPIRNDHGTLVASISFLSDVTAQKEAESRMIQTAQLAAVGQVAAGAAHNINNVLAAIAVSAELLQMDPAALGPTVARDILAAVERGSSMVKKLYRLAGRGEQPKQEKLHAQEAFRGVLQLIQPQLARNEIKLVQGVPDDVVARADASLVHQVLMNLVINALHVMPKGGVLTLRARRRDDKVELTVSDTGTGIAPENLQRIFTPFFTTKGSDVGTGLGLSTSLYMARAMGGDLLVESKLGAGSTFTIQLPAEPGPGEG